jgi:hypothetical protein
MPDPALSRRALLALGAALAAAPAVALEAPPSLRFAVFRNGAKVGDHRMRFSRTPSGLEVVTEVAMTIRVGPVPVFRYTHRATEQWRDGAFTRLETQSSSNGRRERVEALATDAGVRIENAAGLLTAPAASVPLTHWNPAIYGRPLFNPQTGRMLKVTMRRRDGEPLPGGGSGRLLSIRGEAEIDDWYDSQGVWVALRGRLPDHSQLEYRREA